MENVLSVFHATNVSKGGRFGDRFESRNNSPFITVYRHLQSCSTHVTDTKLVRDTCRRHPSETPVVPETLDFNFVETEIVDLSLNQLKNYERYVSFYVRL